MGRGLKDKFEKLVWEPEEDNLVFNNVGFRSLSVPLSSSLSDLNKQPSKEEVSSKPVNTQDGPKFTLTETVRLRLKNVTFDTINGLLQCWRNLPFSLPYN